jgi:predicted regulator of Ras-like GTPase activity (Roadblock/LC7/MglB family)
MSAVIREASDDIDSLFSDLEENIVAPAAKEHLAVTMRPDPARAIELRSVPPATVRAEPVSSALTKAPPANGENASAPTTEAVLPMVPPPLAEALKVVNAVRGVLGYVVRDADGRVASRGGVDARFADRVAYVARLAALVGDELGLEGLREVQVLGAERRMASVLARDGSAVAVLATADAEIDDLSGEKRG